MMKKEVVDVVIVGGGPSGLRTASLLTQAGLAVLVLEKKTSIGSDVICTGIVGLETFSRFGLSRDSVLSEMRSVKLVSPFGSVIEYEHPRAFAYIVDRQRFDSNLAASVSSAGGRVMTGVTAEKVVVGNGRVVIDGIEIEGGRVSFEARMIVLATGVGFNLHHRLGLGRPADFLNGAQIETGVDLEKVPRIFFGGQIAPGGFAWAVPAAGGRIRLGLLAGKNAASHLEDFLAREYPEIMRPEDRSRIKSRPIVQTVEGPSFSDGVLAVGEAAGQIKTTTGGGISYGLTCAGIAADTVLAAFEDGVFGADGLSRYETAWKNLLEREISIGYQARKLCSRLTDRQIERLFRLAQTDGILPIIREKADFDRHSDLLLALFERVSFLRVFRNLASFVRPGSFS